MLERLIVSLTCLAVSAPAAPLTFTHMADASAAEWLGGGLFVAASDEDNVLRVYRVPQGGAPVAEWDLSPHLRLEAKSPEADIEGSATLGDTVYWITSHAPNKEGKPRPNRRRFFATRIRVGGAGKPAFEFVGEPVSTLLDALCGDPRYAGYKLAEAALRPPKTEGGLNIESLCDTPEGGLLIGFRSPCPRGRALLALLENPAEAVRGRPPRFGAPLELGLGGNGVRSMIRRGGGYLIMSGSPLSGGEPRLYRWDGRGQSAETPLAGLAADATPEALLAAEGGGRETLYILSDDGTRLVGGVPAKALADAAQRTFRAFAVEPTMR
jgi:hypothetical protein